MWKLIAIVSCSILALQTVHQMRPQAIAKDQSEIVEGPQKLAEAAMQRLRNKDLHGMFVVLQEVAAPNQQLNTERIDEAVEQLNKLRDAFAERFGRSTGEVEFLRRETLGSSFMRFVYLERFERHVFIWRLTFSKSANQWNLFDLNWECNPQLPQALFKID